MKISHCSECGNPYADVVRWPRNCDNCGVQRWLNPVPVVAVMQPVMSCGLGLVVAKRAIEPCRGEWALIGGFMECNESVEEAGRREFREETSLELAADPKIAFTAAVGGRVRQQLMLMTVVEKALDYETFLTAKPCAENEEIGLLFANGGVLSRSGEEENIELAFPTHREAVAKFFAGEYTWD